MKIKIFLFLMFVFFQGLFADVMIKEVRGDVYFLNEKNEKKNLKKGDLIKRGYSIFTSSSSYAEIVLDDNAGVIILYENTKFVLGKSTQTQTTSFIDMIFGVKELNAEEGESFWDYLYGRAVFVLKNLSGKSYNVRTIQAVCGVRGTSFMVNSDDKSSEVSVYNGEVEVIKGETKKLLKRNYTAYITETDIKIENRLSKIAEREKERALKIEKYLENLKKKIDERNSKISEKLDKLDKK